MKNRNTIQSTYNALAESRPVTDDRSFRIRRGMPSRLTVRQKKALLRIFLATRERAVARFVID